MATLVDAELVLRPPLPEDAAGIADTVQRSLEALGPWMPWATADYDEAAALEWIATSGDEHPFLITDDQGSVMGTCGLNRLDTVNGGANLGYWLRTDQTGRGLATRATRLLAGYGLVELGLTRIEIIMSVENDASRRVAERAGATYEGILRSRLLLHGRHHDAHSYSLTASDLDTA